MLVSSSFRLASAAVKKNASSLTTRGFSTGTFTSNARQAKTAQVAMATTALLLTAVALKEREVSLLLSLLELGMN
jgi:hypothetical protein